MGVQPERVRLDFDGNLETDWYDIAGAVALSVLSTAFIVAATYYANRSRVPDSNSIQTSTTATQPSRMHVVSTSSRPPDKPKYVPKGGKGKPWRGFGSRRRR